MRQKTSNTIESRTYNVHLHIFQGIEFVQRQNIFNGNIVHSDDIAQDIRSKDCNSSIGGTEISTAVDDITT